MTCYNMKDPEGKPSHTVFRSDFVLAGIELTTDSYVRLFNIGNCQYKLPRGAPDPKPQRYHKRKFRPSQVGMDTINRQTFQYLKWALPELSFPEVVDVIGSTNLTRVKDGGRVRWIDFHYPAYNPAPLKRGRKYKPLKKVFRVEIPFWDFDDTATEETEQ